MKKSLFTLLTAMTLMSGAMFAATPAAPVQAGIVAEISKLGSESWQFAKRINATLDRKIDAVCAAVTPQSLQTASADLQVMKGAMRWVIKLSMLATVRKLGLFNVASYGLNKATSAASWIYGGQPLFFNGLVK